MRFGNWWNICVVNCDGSLRKDKCCEMENWDSFAFFFSTNLVLREPGRIEISCQNHVFL